MENLLEEYSQEVQDVANAAAKEAADLTMSQLKSSSPKQGRRGGKYARGWKVKAGEAAKSYIVHNSTNPGLTHVLENGHVARNQYGTWGRVRAIKHIAPAAEAGIQRFNLAVKARLKG